MFTDRHLYLHCDDLHMSRSSGLELKQYGKPVDWMKSGREKSQVRASSEWTAMF